MFTAFEWSHLSACQRLSNIFFSCTALPLHCFYSLVSSRLLHLSAMARGCTLPNVMRETVVRMSAAFSPGEIRTYTAVSERQQSRILKLWKETGSSIPAPDTVARRGRPRHLSAEEVFVSDSLLAHLLFASKLRTILP